MRIGIPFWMLLVALAVGVALAMVLYFRNRKQHYGKPLTVTLFILRTLIGGIVTLLLFNPYIRQRISVLEQPTLVLAHDNSASIILSKDSAFFKKEYLAQFEDFRNALNDDFQVDEYLFGQEVKDFNQLDFSDQLTDISSVLQSVDRRYYKRNVGAVVLFSDGVYNRGFEPSLLVEKYPFPIHTVVLGDTLSYPDLFVKDVHYNKKVSLGATFPVRVVVGARDCSGGKATLTLTEDGRVVASKELEISSNRYSKELDFMLEADQKGVKQIEIEIKGLKDESQQLNNLKRVFVEVRDEKYKILCLADAPHPDLGAIKSVLNEDCEMDFLFGRDVIPELSKYQLLVLHQTPSQRTDMVALQSQLEKNKKIPTLVVVGGATDVVALNKLQRAVELHKGSTNALLDVKGSVNTSFGTFLVSDKLREQVVKYPPLALPHLEMNWLSNHDELLFQEVLGVKSGSPLMTFVKADRKMAFVFGTNVWRWRLFNYYQQHNSQVFDELFSKTLKYLLLSRDDGSAVFCKEEYYSNEPVVINAELRNPSNELVTEPDLSITIVNKKTGETYDYVFSKREHDYELNAGVLPEGIYTYRAMAESGDKKVSLTGSFSVVSVGIEAQQLTADIARMRSLSAATNGKCYTVDQIPQLLEDLKADARITSVEHHDTRFEDLIHSKWIFFVLIGLAAIEWVLRKMFGTY
ncbi:MAG: hypothetical protein J6P73_04245 [Bacteroidales bacterium]|nr:hypothetical protein [Bacteroidales bacterium]